MTARFSLRTADPRDFTAVSALLAASYAELFAVAYEPQVLARALPLMTKANAQLLASGRFYLAQTEQGALIGCGGWSIEQPGTGKIRPGEGHIRHFATHPDWTRRGVGGALLARCLQDARAAGDRELHLPIEPGGGRFLPGASGFVVVGPIDVVLTPDISIAGVLMRYDFPR